MSDIARRLTGLHGVFLHLSLLLSYLAVATGGGVPAWLIIGFPIALAAAYFFHASDFGKASHNNWWNALIVVVLLGSIVQYLLSPALNIMVIGVQFVLVLTVIKLFSRQGPRDELQLYALSFLCMAAASEINSQFIYGVIFVAYVLTGTFGLALLHLKTEAEQHAGLQKRRSSPFDAYYVSVLATISILVCLSSVLIFFAFPRIGLGFFSDPSRNSISIAGFDDEVQVGDHGTVRENPAVVMRAEFNGDEPPNYHSFRWRTRTFDHFDGSGWSRQDDDTRSSAPYSTSRRYDTDFLYSPALRQTFDEADAQTVDIELEPMSTDAIPTIWPTTEIRLGDADGDSRAMWESAGPQLDYDDYDDIYHDLDDDTALSYQLTLQDAPPESELRRQSGDDLDGTAASRYLQTPETDQRLRALADDLTDGADSRYAKAEVIESYFRDNFEYTTDLPQIEGDDAIAEFVFEHQRGHCEYYATAATILLREAGVPTRMVTGFLGGSWNDVGDYLTVRQGDAHAWVEVYVPDIGWVPVDPTPPIESAFLERSNVVRALSDSVDAMRRGWAIWFVDYDLDNQVSLLRDIGRSIAAGAPEPDESDEADEESVIPLRHVFFWVGWTVLVVATVMYSRSRRRIMPPPYLPVLSLALGMAVLWTGWFHSWTPHWMIAGGLSILAAGLAIPLRNQLTRRSPESTLRSYFEAIEDAAADRGLRRGTDEGPGVFLDRLSRKLPECGQEIQNFRTLYLEVRFGGRPVDDRDSQQADAAFDAIISALRNQP